MSPAQSVPIALLDESDELSAMTSPIRRRILEALREPDSAAGLAIRLGLSRQKVNYHLRLLEDAGLVELEEERPRRGFHARVMRRVARSYILDPTAYGLTDELLGETDRLSAEALMASAARTLRDVAQLQSKASGAGKRLATLAIEGEVKLSSPQDLVAFGEEVAKAISRIADRYCEDRGGRQYRFTMGMHQEVKKERKRK